ncbi:peroxiredoxin [Cytobacillus praedii]|uniref:peroxiredoxin n=1 Tax=Cytobacillus praedii TaxID=1742358 RepID=UPI003F7F1FEB
MSKLDIGSVAPDFELPSTGKTKSVRLSDLKGKFVILFFYTKDHTIFCTKEVCDFRDNLAKLKSIVDIDTEVIGISPDTLISHKIFTAKQKLNFPLLSDINREVAKKYRVSIDITGGFSLVERTTYIINPEGRIAYVFEDVEVDGHVEQIMSVLKNENSLNTGKS